MELSMSEKLMHSTIRIEVLDHSGRIISTGTGFFFNFTIDDKHNIPVLVTNKHVVSGANIGRLVFTVAKNGNPIYGETIPYTIQDFEQAFIFHPDSNVDLCIMPINPIYEDANIRFNKQLFNTWLDESIIPKAKQLEQLGTLEDVIMIGYPNGLWDSTNNLPIIRKGVTAIHPKFDYNGKTDIVVDIASFPGSSGSPVCIYNEGSYRQGNGVTLGNRLLFLGVLYAGPQQSVTGEIGTKVIPTSVVPVSITNVMMNLGYAVKSSRLLDFKPILNELLK